MEATTLAVPDRREPQDPAYGRPTLKLGEVPADCWRGGMQPRAVRVKVTNINARFGKSIVELLNLSVTGALLATNAAVPVGSEWALQLRAEGERLPLKARVVRVVRKADSPDTPNGAGDVWLAGVAFVDLSLEMQKAVRRLIAMGRSVDAASTRT